LKAKVLEFSNKTNFSSWLPEALQWQEFTHSLLPVEPEAATSLWEATAFDKCIKNVNGFIIIVEILT
jgi:hypothetical protein